MLQIAVISVAVVISATFTWLLNKLARIFSDEDQ